MPTEQQENRTLGGYKATLHNPNTSEEAKKHAAEVLDAQGETLSSADQQYLSSHKHGEANQDHHHHGHQHHVAHEAHGYHDKPIPDEEKDRDEHDRRVLGGFRAAVDSDKTTEKARDHAEEVLVEHGEKI